MRRAAILFVSAAAVCWAVSGTPWRTAAEEKPPKSDSAPVSAPASGPTAAEAPKRQTLRVSTAEELVASVGSDRVIELAPGDYWLSDVAERPSEALRWDAEFDGKTLTLKGVRKLSLVGKPKEGKPVRLLVRPRYVFTLNLDGCRDVELSGLVMGHEPDKGECASGVLGATGCEGLTLRDCDLFGCGTEGLTLKKVKGLKCVGTTVRDCSYGILTAESCEGLAFEDCRFAGNREFWGLRFESCGVVTFDGCTVEDNACEETLFKAVGSEVRFHRGKLLRNRASAAINNAEALTIKDSKADGNEFRGGK
jgi:hypothetical protein